MKNCVFITGQSRFEIYLQMFKLENNVCKKCLFIQKLISYIQTAIHVTKLGGFLPMRLLR